MAAGPDWLASFQARFSACLRTPLATTTGTFRVELAEHVAGAGSDVLPGPRTSAAERLAVYNRQYWFRLFGVMQGQFPLTARLLGMWTFNHLAQRFLLDHPPHHADLHRAAEGFCELLEHYLDGLATVVQPASCHALPPPPPRAALLEAAELDAAWQRVWLAPEQPLWRPTADEAASLALAWIEMSASVALIEEHWPLVELRNKLTGDDGESAVPLPPAHPSARHVAIFRTAEGIGQLPLAPLEARLFELLPHYTLGQALAVVASEHAGAEAQLAQDVRKWLARGMELGFFVGASFEVDE